MPVATQKNTQQPPPTTKKLALNFDLELLTRLRALAGKNERTVTAELMRAIRSHLANAGD